MSASSPPAPPPETSQLNYWNSENAVAYYSYDHRPVFLYYPELRLLGMFQDRWPQMRVLDIGVGAGRTTQYFAELAGTYVGIDFSQGMVDRCQQRFAGRWPGASFQQGDATDLHQHADNSYDLVLFSFNGVDCMSPEKREMALKEMQRVCKPGGWVVFSSHNVYSIPLIPKFEIHPHPMRFLEEARRWWSVKQKNPPVEQVMTTPYVRYYDATIGDNYLIFSRPEVQARDLQALGFTEVRRYANNDGRELITDQDGQHPSVSWVYYFCRKQS
ncbi:MAG: SAM-dependent methyltransferase [Verrucomicrobiaceae bacterium]|nr:SAM-dependent methyltransferase [Verrucomicrobiaceae bacterium]